MSKQTKSQMPLGSRRGLGLLLAAIIAVLLFIVLVWVPKPARPAFGTRGSISTDDGARIHWHKTKAAGEKVLV